MEVVADVIRYEVVAAGISAYVQRGAAGPGRIRQRLRLRWTQIHPSTVDLRKGIPMGLGLGIFLMAVGAVLYFAVETTVSGVDIDVVGIILMVAGAVTLILGLIMNAQRSNTTVTQRRQDVRRPPYDE